MRKPRTPSGLRPYTRVERKRLWKELQRAEFPDVVRQRLLVTCEALERDRAPPRPALSPPTPPSPRISLNG